MLLREPTFEVLKHDPYRPVKVRWADRDFSVGKFME